MKYKNIFKGPCDMQMNSMAAQLNFINGLKLHVVQHLDQEMPRNLKELYLAAKAAEQQANMVYTNKEWKNEELECNTFKSVICKNIQSSDGL